MFDDLADPLGPPDGDALGTVLAKARHRRVVRRTAAVGVLATALAVGGVAAAVAASSSPSTHVNIAAPTTTTTTAHHAVHHPHSTTTTVSTTTTSTTASTSTTTVPPTTTTTTTTFPIPPVFIEHLHATLAIYGSGVSGGRLDMWEVQPRVWTVTTTIEGAVQDHYTVGVVTQKGQSVFLNTICGVTGQGTIGCSATVNLDRYLPGGTPINVAVGAYDPSSNGYPTVLQGTFS